MPLHTPASPKSVPFPPKSKFHRRCKPRVILMTDLELRGGGSQPVQKRPENDPDNLAPASRRYKSSGSVGISPHRLFSRGTISKQPWLTQNERNKQSRPVTIEGLVTVDLKALPPSSSTWWRRRRRLCSAPSKQEAGGGAPCGPRAPKASPAWARTQQTLAFPSAWMLS